MATLHTRFTITAVTRLACIAGLAAAAPATLAHAQPTDPAAAADVSDVTARPIPATPGYILQQPPFDPRPAPDGGTVDEPGAELQPVPPAPDGMPEPGNDIDDPAIFYDSLAPYGEWIDVPGHGHMWRPYGTRVDWRPYVDGRWVYTRFGWTWVSDYEWGWAAFHYGSWLNLNGFGWMWLPGTIWAPAWVTWRIGVGYVGWAPWSPFYASTVAWGYNWWVFIPNGYFYGYPVAPHCMRTRDVRRIYNKTRAIGSTTTVRGGGLKPGHAHAHGAAPASIEITGRINTPQSTAVMMAGGPTVAEVQSWTGYRVNQREIDFIPARPNETSLAPRAGSSAISVVRPHFSEAKPTVSVPRERPPEPRNGVIMRRSGESSARLQRVEDAQGGYFTAPQLDSADWLRSRTTGTTTTSTTTTRRNAPANNTLKPMSRNPDNATLRPTTPGTSQPRVTPRDSAAPRLRDDPYRVAPMHTVRPPRNSGGSMGRQMAPAQTDGRAIRNVPAPSRNNTVAPARSNNRAPANIQRAPTRTAPVRAAPPPPRAMPKRK